MFYHPINQLKSIYKPFFYNKNIHKIYSINYIRLLKYDITIANKNSKKMSKVY